MPAAKSILFVSHKADRSGAPVLLYNIIKAYKQQGDTSFKILLLQNGELADDFKKLGPTFTWDTKTRNVPPSLTGYLKFHFLRLVFICKSLIILFKIRKTSLVFLNTITNGHIHKKLFFLRCRYVCYVHELEAAIHFLTSKSSLNITLSHTDHFLAVSMAVKQNLIVNHGVNNKMVTVIPTSVPVVKRDKNEFKLFKEALFKTYKISADTIIIGIAGSNEWRKGFDLLVPLIKIYFTLFPESNVQFVWKGFKQSNASAFEDMYDIDKALISKHIHLLPHGSDGMECMAVFDIHLLLSREDPYPLVVLEAASFSIPTVCFENSGGAVEFVEEDAGCCIPYGDLLQMAKSLYKLSANNEMRARMGLAAQEKLQQRHGEVEAMKHIAEQLDRLLTYSEAQPASTQINTILST